MKIYIYALTDLYTRKIDVDCSAGEAGTMMKAMWKITWSCCFIFLSCFYSIAIAGNLEPPGPPGPTMKTLDQVEPRIPIPAAPFSTPASAFTIETPGSYYLEGDRRSTGSGIVVTVDNVTIDLMGYTLSGYNSTGIGATDRKNIEIKNGTITGFATGIDASGNDSRYIRVENMRVISVINDGIRTGSHSVVKNSISSGGLTGINVWNNCLVNGNICKGNRHNGINAWAGCIVEGNTASENANNGISVGWNCTVKNNTAQENTKVGISASTSCLIAGNTVRDNGEQGIFASQGSTLKENIALSNTGNGIETQQGCLIAGNTSNDNEGTGIYAGSESNIRANTVRNNKGDGIFAADGSLVDGNSSTLNAGDGIEVRCCCLVTNNSSHSNGYHGNGAGIYATSSHNRIDGNNLGLNTDRGGIVVDLTGNIIVKNTAKGTQTIPAYDIADGNNVGTIGSDPTTAGPWDNFQYTW
jgi:parallel beta-helix repeat protein